VRSKRVRSAKREILHLESTCVAVGKTVFSSVECVLLEEQTQREVTIDFITK
jgi:hypothetical protein